MSECTHFRYVQATDQISVKYNRRIYYYAVCFRMSQSTNHPVFSEKCSQTSQPVNSSHHSVLSSHPPLPPLVVSAPRGVAMRRKCSQFNPSLIKREKWVFIYISAPCLPHGQLTNSADYTSLLSLPPLLTPLTHWVYFIRLLLKVCVLCRNIRFGFKLCGFFRPQWRIFLFGRNALQTFV